MISDNRRPAKSRLGLIRANWRDLIWWRNVALMKIGQPMMEAFNDGIHVLDESWDNLIILDACRYDAFGEMVHESALRGKLECRTSIATDTGEFMIKNFFQRRCDDVVYISANPFADKFLKERVHKLISVWRTDWSREDDTVLPGVMCERTLEVARQYPSKRIVAHFIQPHYPYIGHEELNVSKFYSARPVAEQPKGGGYKDDSFFSISAKLVYARAMKDRDTHWRAYMDNLRAALLHVQKLVKVLPGKTVISADHGEAFGEKISRLLPIRVYGHMECMRIKALTRVPWFVIDPEEKIETSVADDVVGRAMRGAPLSPTLYP